MDRAHKDHRHGKESHVVAIFAMDRHEHDAIEVVEQMVLKTFLPSSSSSSSSNGETEDNAGFSAMGILDILRESTTLLRSNASPLMWAMLLLICPLSGLHLSGTLLHSHIATTLASNLHSLAVASGLSLQSSLFQSLSSSITQSFLSHALSAPIFFTLFLLAKALIIFTVSSTYSSRKPSFPMFSSIAFKLWKRLSYTHLSVYALVASLFTTAILLLLFLINLFAALHVSEGLALALEMAMGLSYTLAFAHLIIVGNLATVVCVLEDNYGIGALSRAYNMIKGRTQLALTMFLSTAVCTAMVESLYLYRVIGVEEGSYMIDTASRLWEAPLLVFMYSFLLLMDVIMSCVFYFFCKSASLVQKKEARREHAAMNSELVG